MIVFLETKAVIIHYISVHTFIKTNDFFIIKIGQYGE